AFFHSPVFLLFVKIVELLPPISGPMPGDVWSEINPQRGRAVGHHHLAQLTELFGLLSFSESHQEIRITRRVMLPVQTHRPILFLSHTTNNDGKLPLRAADVAAAF